MTEDEWKDQSWWRRDAGGVYAACEWKSGKCQETGDTYTHDQVFRWNAKKGKFSHREIDGLKFRHWKGDSDNKLVQCSGFKEEDCDKTYKDELRVVKKDGMDEEDKC